MKRLAPLNATVTARYYPVTISGFQRRMRRIIDRWPGRRVEDVAGNLNEAPRPMKRLFGLRSRFGNRHRRELEVTDAYALAYPDECRLFNPGRLVPRIADSLHEADQ